MKSDQIIFANSNFQTIDFEIKERPIRNIFIGIFLFSMIPLIFLSCILTSIAAIDSDNYRLIGSAIFWLMIFVGSIAYFSRKAGRYLRNPAAIFREDARDPILYLRSFSDDLKNNQYRTDKKTPEELLCSGLAKAGHVIAVGNPTEKIEWSPYIGATRIYLDHNWKESMEKLMLISSLVVVEASISESVRWELETARRLVKPERILISFLSIHISGSHQEFYYDFRTHFNGIFSTPAPPYDKHVGFIYFDSTGSPKLIKLDGIQNFKFKFLEYGMLGDKLTEKQIREGLGPVYEQIGLINDPK